MRNSMGNTSVVTLPLVTSPSASFYLVNRRLCLGLADAWVKVDYGTRCQPTWVYKPGAPNYSARVNLIFFIYFIDFVANLQKLYLELGVSKWGEPNFFGFILKCTI